MSPSSLPAPTSLDLISLTSLFSPHDRAPQEEDSFLIKMMHRYGFGAWDRIRAEIHQSRQFRFDWFFKSRSAKEIQSRADQIIRFIEKEMDDLEQVAAGGGVQKKKKAKLSKLQDASA